MPGSRDQPDADDVMSSDFLVIASHLHILISRVENQSRCRPLRVEHRDRRLLRATLWCAQTGEQDRATAADAGLALGESDEVSRSYCRIGLCFGYARGQHSPRGALVGSPAFPGASKQADLV